jgi:phage shock protein PspC (stress-responsive transcriptional regulator)
MAIVLKKSLYKSTEYKIFTGVASGIGDYINAGHSSIRVLFILLTLASGIGLVLYITLSILLPTENEIIERQDRDFYYNITHGGIIEDSKVSQQDYSNIINKAASTQNIVALIIIFLGVFTLQFKVVPWELIPAMWRYPALIITVGFGFVLKSIANKK